MAGTERRDPISVDRVRRLVASQFPQWSNLAVARVRPGGWDNHTFRLGERLSIRLPSAERYARQLEREIIALPHLQTVLPLSIPEIVGIGEPVAEFPRRWSVRTWIEGQSATKRQVSPSLAKSVGRFLSELRAIETAEGPPPGTANFWRGGTLETYSEEAKRAIELWPDAREREILYAGWNVVARTSWQAKPVWVHGDLTPANLLLRTDRLVAVIDWGNAAIGDPACDLAIAWTACSNEARDAFRSAVAVDKPTWDRGLGWALWKALVVATGLNSAPRAASHSAVATVRRILRELRKRD